jgi:protein-S-isoprenylcysteine O-methyltransferase Ste14
MSVPKSAPGAGHIASVLAMLVGLPPFTFYLWMCVQYNGGAFIVPGSGAEIGEWLARVPAPTWKAAFLFLGWFLFQALLQIYAPGKTVEGTPLEDGSRLKYKLNGWASWWITWILLAAAAGAGWISPAILADELGPLLVVVNIFTFAMSLFLYVYGKSRPPHQRTGNAVYDFVMGAALNPRLGSFDLKLFCESRPGLIGWVAINLSLAAKQYQLHGAVSVAMLLVNAFHLLYVADYFFFEEAILTTWDIKHENFGWMLCFGDLVWVPFTYTLQAFYLVDHPHELPVWSVAGIVVLNLAGYFLFRTANLQKHRFRKDPEQPIWGRRPEYIQTAAGSRLLVSGWWGLGRHLNYLGDLMMGLAWCLPCGFEHPLPYFYFVYFAILLVHREERDHHACAAKYGSDWEAYCRRVPWRIVPGVY